MFNFTKATIAAVYFQDQIRISPMFEIVAGLRFDSFKLEVDDLRPHINAEFDRSDELWSPRLGLIFKAEPVFDLGVERFAYRAEWFEITAHVIPFSHASFLIAINRKKSLPLWLACHCCAPLRFRKLSARTGMIP